MLPEGMNARVLLRLRLLDISVRNFLLAPVGSTCSRFFTDNFMIRQEQKCLHIVGGYQHRPIKSNWKPEILKANFSSRTRAAQLNWTEHTSLVVTNQIKAVCNNLIRRGWCVSGWWWVPTAYTLRVLAEYLYTNHQTRGSCDVHRTVQKSIRLWWSRIKDSS